LLSEIGKVRARHKVPWWTLCLVSFLLVVPVGGAWAETPPLSQWLRQAREERFHEDRYWQVLLHYRQDWRGRRSPVDDPDFFFSPSGKEDPAAELEATILALFGPESETRNAARCRFPARYQWLAEKLEVAADPVTAAVCPDLALVLDRVDPRSATLVFPGSYPNSPASMFGHTLLNFSGPRESKLLAHAANYSAFTDESNGFAYAVKGLTGLYRGYFSVLPYYEKLKEYSGLERRDIWEYPLALTVAETRRMFLHLWELRDIYSDYFFFDENCSYNLLYLLEAARPSLNLTASKPLWVLPVDTIRRLDQAGLIRGARFRPSPATVLRQEMAGLTSGEIAVARDLAKGVLDVADLPLYVTDADTRRRILEVAFGATEQDFLARRLDLQTYRTRVLALLTARSRLGRGGLDDKECEPPTRPDHGHGTSRLSLGVGYFAGSWGEELRYRPVYHDLLDDQSGYLSGAQIVLGQISLRYFPERERLRVERLDLIDLCSLTPVSRWETPISWQVCLGMQRSGSTGAGRRLTAYFNPGAGFSAQISKLSGYALLESELSVGNSMEKGYGLGGGGSIGALLEWGPWRVHGRIRLLDYPLGGRGESWLFAFDQNYRLNRQHSLSCETLRILDFGRWETTSLLLWNRYW